MPIIDGLPQWPSLPEAAPERLRLLVVEDDASVRNAILALVAGEARDVRAVDTGGAAVELLGREPVDLVLLDINLPDMTGLEVLRRAREAGLKVTVIVVSGDGSIDSAITALRLGAHEYIRKPFEPAALQRSVENALTARRLALENNLMRARLEHSERLHRYLVDHSPDLIFAVDPQGRFWYVNERFGTLLGYSREELTGAHYSAIVHEDDLARAARVFHERRMGERATRNVELRLKGKPAQDRGPAEPASVIVSVSAIGIYGAQPEGAPLERRFLGTYGVARDITARKRAEQIIAFHAYHDALTGLPNRALFLDRLKQAIAHARRHQRRLGVLFVDLDRFKLVNDTYGHLKGDLLLQHTAARLRKCLRSTDTLSRIGGDEFLALVPDLESREDALAVAKKILHELNQPFFLGEGEFTIGVSVGIAVHPEDGTSEEDLIRNADIAMYHVKRRGKNAAAFFSPDMSASFSERIQLENDLRGALQRAELELHFQPIHNVRTGGIERVEALLRWRHPVHGLLAPGRFISIAEETGLVHAIGDFVLQSACAQLECWRAGGFADLGVAVNLSPREFDRIDLVERVIGAVERHRLPPHALEVEITENVLIEDVEVVARKAALLREHGVGIAIDDFGTRYSSLAYLQSLPISAIKIDQAFVRDLGQKRESHAIVAAMIGIARGFGLGFVAEGVERAEHLESLTGLGCDVMQGFFFSRPMPAAEMGAYLARHRMG
jgi:diguanylate cyclase (GGDEF)-like protein/PAS domain S-box-containing protein